MRSPFRTLVLAALSLALVAFPVMRATNAWAAAPALTEAQGLYDSARFDEAIAKLREALSTGAVTGSDVVAARALMGRCLVKSGNRVEAKQAFKTVLRADPGFRLDPVSVPPDEMEVFGLASKEIQAEQIEAGRRIPASLSGHLGWGLGGRSDLEDFLKANGDKELERGIEFGGSVRFPVAPRWSVDVGITHLGDKSSVVYGGTTVFKVRTEAIAIVGSVVYTVISGSKNRVHLALGGGPLAQAQLRLTPEDLSAIQLVDGRTGVCIVGGIEDEFMLHPKVGLLGFAGYRMANSGKLNYGPLYGPVFDLEDLSADFSGVVIHLGLRGYIGY